MNERYSSGCSLQSQGLSLPTGAFSIVCYLSNIYQKKINQSHNECKQRPSLKQLLLLLENLQKLHLFLQTFFLLFQKSFTTVFQAFVQNFLLEDALRLLEGKCFVEVIIEGESVLVRVHAAKKIIITIRKWDYQSMDC